MLRLLIEGGHPLKGDVDLPGSTSSAISALSASLLTSELLILDGAPKSSEVLGFLEVLEFLGLRPIIDWEKHLINIEPVEIKLKAVPANLCLQSRFYPLILGPLLCRFGEAVIPEPKTLGFHSLDRLLSILSVLGITVKEKNGLLYLKGKIKSGAVSFTKNTVMGTLIVILASILGESQVHLENASEEPEVSFLCEIINEMGGKIEKESPRVLNIIGVEKIGGSLIKIPKDRDLAVFFATLATISRGDILVRGIENSDLTAFLSKLQEINGCFQTTGEGVRFWREKETELLPIEVETRPHPGFMSNWGPFFSLIQSQSSGISVLHETVFSSRFSYLPFLQNLGLEYQIFDPQTLNHAQFYSFDEEDDIGNHQHAVKIFGPASLKPARFVKEADDLESNLPILAAALTAPGQSEIIGDQLINGYEGLIEKLKKLGAKIEVV